jgi:hypothetical protein
MKSLSRTSRRAVFILTICALLLTLFSIPNTRVSAGRMLANSSGFFYLPWTSGTKYTVSRAGGDHANAVVAMKIHFHHQA